MKFNGYSLDQDLVAALFSLGYRETTLVQEKTLSIALKGQSFIAKSATGSGKTHAYLVPVINNLTTINKLQAIIIEPTLELCSQTYNFANEISKLTKKFKVSNFCLNNNETGNIVFELPTIGITTPQKLFDLVYKNKCLDVSQVQSLVLDEIDMLLEGEEGQNVINLIDRLAIPQIMIFTATMKEHQIASLKKLFKISNLININGSNIASDNVKHYFVDIKHKSFTDALMLFLKHENPYFTLVFSSKKSNIQKVYHALNERGIKCALITSDVSLRERKNILKRINDNEFNLVLCSDLASRGIDFKDVSHVVSLDIPLNIDYYYHRSGRTGRYKNKGDSYIFYDNELNIKEKKTLEKKLSFDYLILKEDGLRKDKKHTPQVKKKNEKLEAEIHKELAKVRSNKVKPNYKKKMKKAVKKAIRNHKRKIIMENLKSKRKMEAYKD